MPLTSDERIVALSEKILAQFDGIFGLHPGFRPAHAKGTLLSGTFTAAASAATLSRAPHLNRPSTPVVVRFSNSTGIPQIPDNAPNAHPHGCAIRFYVAERSHTDIISVSAEHFPARNGDEFLEFLGALAKSDPAKIAGSPLEAFLGTHPKTLKAVQSPNPAPASLATERYFGVTALKFINKDGAARFGRYRVIPDAGVAHLTDAEAAGRGPNYLMEEIAARVTKGPVKFRVMAQLADAGDIVNDATELWPENRTQVELGTVSLTAAVANDAHLQQHTIFDPIPRVDGIEPSDDPLLELRAALYLISGRRRRAAEEAGAAKA